MSNAVAVNRMPVISLVEDDALSALLRPLIAPFQRQSVQIPVRFGTPAERNMLGARIDRAVADADRAVLLVAQGAGCLAAAWWARLTPKAYVSRVAGALLVQPEDEVDQRGTDFASPRVALPFPSVLVSDGGSSRLGSQTVAREWGSQLVDARLQDVRLPGLRRTCSFLERLTAAIVERDLATAETLLSLNRAD